MKKVLISLLSILLLTTVIIMGCAQQPPSPAPKLAPTPTPTPAPAPAKPIELNFALYQPPMHPDIKGIYEPWAQEVGKRTDGRVKVNIFAGEALGKQTEQYDLVLKNAAQLTQVVGPQYPGRFPLTDVFNLPFLVPHDSLNPVGKAIRDMVHEKYLIPIHFKDVKVLWNGKYQPNQIQMAKKPVKTMEDLKGQVIGIPGGKILISFIKILGGSPEMVVSADIYTNLERNVINGEIITMEAVSALKLFEVVKFVTMTNLGSAANCAVMNQKVWDSLPPDIQKIIVELNPMAADLQAKVSQGMVQASIAACKKAGIELIELSPEERARWVEATKAVESDWVAEMDAKGLPGTALYKDILKMLGR